MGETVPIRKITPAGLVSTLAGQAGIQGSMDGPVETALFNYPNNLTVGAQGFVYVTDDGNHTIREISMLQTEATTPFAREFTILLKRRQYAQHQPSPPRRMGEALQKNGDEI